MSLLQLPTQTEAKPALLRAWREIAFLTLIGMEMCWMATWYTNLSYTSRPVPLIRVYLVLGAFYIIAHYLVRWMNDLHIRLAYRRGIFMLLILVGLWVGLQFLLYFPEVLSPLDTVRRVIASFAVLDIIPSEFWVLLAILLIVSRAVSLAQRTLGIDRIIASFQLGLLMFFAYGLLPLVDAKIVLWAIFAFLWLGLISMSAGRMYETSRARGARLVRTSRSWLLGILVIALVIVGIGLLPAILLPSNASYSLAVYLVTGIGLVVGLFVVLAVPVMALILVGLSKLGSIWSRLSIAFNFPDLHNLLKPFNLPTSVDNLVERIAFAKPATLWGILFVLVLVILAGLSWRMWAERNLEVEEGESLLEGLSLFTLLRKQIRKRLQRFRQGIGQNLRLTPAEQLLAAARVRWIYARLMRLCAELDQPRQPAVTPLEFQPDLERIFPGFETETRDITDAYVRVRYGEAIATSAEIARINAAWSHLVQQGRILLKKRPAKTQR